MERKTIVIALEFESEPNEMPANENLIEAMMSGLPDEWFEITDGDPFRLRSWDYE